MMGDRCFFDCTNESPNLINCGVGRIETVRNCSISRGDGLINTLAGVDSIRCHKSCVSTYTSEHHFKIILSTQNDCNLGNDQVIPSKTRRSGTSDFNFKEHCLFCGERCVTLDSYSRHYDRWRKVIQCQTADDFKQNILLTCDVRNNCLADEVRVRISTRFACC